MESPVDKSNPDTAIETEGDVDPRIVGRMADETVKSLDIAKFLPMTCISILTTALMYYLKRQIKDSPPPFFETNKQTAIMMLQQLAGELNKMKLVEATDARTSQDGPNSQGSHGAAH